METFEWPYNIPRFTRAVLEQWSPTFFDGAKSEEVFEHAPPIYAYLFINYICLSVLLYYVHYKTYTKIELKKDENDERTTARTAAEY